MTVLFEHPFDTPTTSVTLRNPQLGDSDTLNLKTRFATAMDGGVYSYKFTEATRRLLLTFTLLKDTDIDDLVIFLTASEGEEVKFTNHDGVIWRGFLLNSPYEIEAQADSLCDGHNILLEFEGISDNMLFLLTEGLEAILLEDGSNLLMEGFS